MKYVDAVLPEFDHEMAKTRQVLERIPDDKMDWKPHPKSNTIGWNANHLADLPHWGTTTITQDQFDFAPVGGKRYELPKLKTSRELVELFDKNVAACHKALAEVKEEDLGKMWSLLNGGQTIFSMPRVAVLRGFVFSHIIHHRAILCVYLRLNNIPVPGMYGPSGDE
jgi:uncharacterized damage-inducible protein DinB